MTLIARREGGKVVGYAGQFRVKGIPFLHLSLRTAKKSEAKERHDAVQLLFTQRRTDVIDQLRSRVLTVEAVVAMVARGDVRPLETLVAPAPAPVAEPPSPWGTVAVVVEEYLGWIAGHHARAKATHATARAQLARFGRHASPLTGGTPIGALPFDRVTSAMVEDYQATLLLLSTPANTVRAYMARVRALWRWAEKKEARRARDERRAPAVLYSPIDAEMISRKTTARDRTLTEDEAERLLAATPEPLLFPVACGLFTGMRLDEVLHLRTDLDVDLELGTLAVREQPTWRPKTDHSVRVIPIAAPLRPILEHHLVHFASERWMVPSLTDANRPFDRKTFWTHFVRVITAAGMIASRTHPQGVTFHTLRHTFASWLVRRGVDLYTVAKLLGDSLAMVEKTYAHLSPDVKAAAVAKLTGAIRVPALATEIPDSATADATE